MQKLIILFISIIIIFTSCEKNTNNCPQINAARAYSNSPITVGQTLKIWTGEVDGTTYQWYGPYNFTSQYTSDSISNAQINNSGWYYLNVNSLDDNNCTKRDSVYVEVRLQQDTAPCTITTNTIAYNNMADQSFSSVYKGIESTYSLMSLYSSSSNGDVNIYFAPRWRNIEPADVEAGKINLPVIVSPAFKT